MNLHEYQSKNLLKKYNIPVPSGEVIFELEAAVNAARKIGGNQWIVKAQIHAGGRGKAGGICLVNGEEELKSAVKALLGKRLITNQTNEHGQPVNQILIEKKSNITRELYLSVVVDRSFQQIVFIASPDGGIEIEKVAEKSPEKILKKIIDPLLGLQPFQCRQLFFELNLDPAQMRSFTDIAIGLYQLFIECDLNLLEINPFIVNELGGFLCLDAKLHIDDNALYRQPKLREKHDAAQEDECEILAQRWKLSYIKLDGNIGCMVNGAGLAMATMDLIKLAGGEPANFLDVGGNANKEQIAEAFKIIILDKNVEGIFVNIFGGIVRCDLIAEGIISAIKEVGICVPVVVRLEGNNAQLGRKKLAENHVNIIVVKDFLDAAKTIVKQVKKQYEHFS